LLESQGKTGLGEGKDVEDGVVPRLSHKGFSKAFYTSSKHPG
jgi:hypothetical protein